MKVPKLNDRLLFEGKEAIVVGLIDQPAVVIEFMDSAKCPTCSANLGKTQITCVISSPMFQQGAEPIQTLAEE